MPYSMLDEAMIVQAYADDPASAESEWFGAFRSGLESLLADDVDRRRDRPRSAA